MSNFYGTPQMVTNGLIFYVDAPNPKSYIGTGTTWNDLSRNAYTLSTTGSSTYSSTYKSMSFPGNSNGYFFLNSNTGINTGQNFTVTAWINCSSISTGTTAGRLSIIGNACSYNVNKGWYWFLQNNGTTVINTLAMTIGNDQSYQYTSNNVFSFNTWVNFTTTVQSGRTIKNYINGGMNNGGGFLVSTGTTIDYTLEAFKIGRRSINPINTDQGFNGYISNVKLYNRILTQSEITQLYNSQKTRFNI